MAKKKTAKRSPAKPKGHQHHYGAEHPAGVHAEKGALLVKKCPCGDRQERYG